MILLLILLFITLLLVALLIGAVSIGGTVFIVLFGDVIVCAVFIVLLIKYLIKRRMDD